MVSVLDIHKAVYDDVMVSTNTLLSVLVMSHDVMVSIDTHVFYATMIYHTDLVFRLVQALGTGLYVQEVQRVQSGTPILGTSNVFGYFTPGFTDRRCCCSAFCCAAMYTIVYQERLILYSSCQSGLYDKNKLLQLQTLTFAT